MVSINPEAEPSKEIFSHGMALDTEYKRVQCNYCGKVVSGFNRLQHHLAGMRGNIIECASVPVEVKEFFSNCLMSARLRRLVQEVGDIFQDDPLPKRSCTSNVKPEGMTGMLNGHVKIEEPELVDPLGDSCFGEMTPNRSGKSVSGTASPLSGRQGQITGAVMSACTSGLIAYEVNPVKGNTNQNGQLRGESPRLVNAVAKGHPREVTPKRVGKSKSYCPDASSSKDPATVMAKRSIGRFFFENGIDFSVVTSHSFKSMMEMISHHKGSVRDCFPSIDELKGWVLDNELNDVQSYVQDVRLSWPRTGCSILLDGWIDDLGRSLINVVVNCPEGPIYLRSADVSSSTRGSDALRLLVEDVLREVGVDNVIQIVAHTWSNSLDALGKDLVDRYRPLFWSVSAAHCISLMLERIAVIDSIKLTLERAKSVTKFIYSRQAVLSLLRKHISTHDLVIASKIKVVGSFLTIEKFMDERRNLQLMFASPEWLTSFWASSAEGIAVVNVIWDKSFWDDVTIAVKASIPLVNAISLINGDGVPNIGFIYETMDQVKETISEEFRGRESQYLPFWDIIDDVWNKILHSPLHAAGYFLNPKLHFTEDFYSDGEVAGGLLVSVVRMAENLHAQDLITQQIDVYSGGKGDFKLGTENDQHHDLSPASWWSRFGGHCPDLQKVAIKILSQTCCGADCFSLKRDLAENLLWSCGRNFIEQRHLEALTYVHYNLQLKRFKMGARFKIVDDQINPTDEWIVDELYHP